MGKGTGSDKKPGQNSAGNSPHSSYYGARTPPRKQKGKPKQQKLELDEGQGLSTARQLYELTATVINELRAIVDTWRELKDPKQWGVTPETERLLHHWRSYAFSHYRLFFCQVEAAEVAPKMGKIGQRFTEHLKNANAEANPELFRIALKLATGAGKTTVMAMLMAWQTVNSNRHSNSRDYTRGFLIVTPGLTIKDRLRVLLPNDPQSYYATRDLVPRDMLTDIARASRFQAARADRDLEGWARRAEGPTRRRPRHAGNRRPNDRARHAGINGLEEHPGDQRRTHHCYREKPGDPDEDELKGDDNIPTAEVPVFRNLWEHIRAHMPKKGRNKSDWNDPHKLPNQLQTALEALYGHHAKTFGIWQQAGIKARPALSLSAKTQPSPNSFTISSPALNAR